MYRKALLLNFTGDVYHWGCYATAHELYLSLRDMGLIVDTVAVSLTHTLAPTPGHVADFFSTAFWRRFQKAQPHLVGALQTADLIVVNGEGTLHHLSRPAINLLYLMWASRQFLQKPVFLVNHSLFPSGTRTPPAPNSPEMIYAQVTRALTGRCARDGFSCEIYRSLGIPVRRGFDCLPRFLQREGLAGRAGSAGYLLISGGVALRAPALDQITELAANAARAGVEVRFLTGAKYAPAREDRAIFQKIQAHVPGLRLYEAQSLEDWAGCIRAAGYLVSGRFHHTIAALALGVPCRAFASNTEKLESILAQLGAPPICPPEASADAQRAFSRDVLGTIGAATRLPNEAAFDEMVRLGGENLADIARFLEAGFPPPAQGETRPQKSPGPK